MSDPLEPHKATALWMKSLCNGRIAWIFLACTPSFLIPFSYKRSSRVGDESEALSSTVACIGNTASYWMFSFLFPCLPFTTLCLHIHTSAFAYFVPLFPPFHWSHPAALGGRLGYIGYTLPCNVLKCLDLG